MNRTLIQFSIAGLFLIAAGTAYVFVHAFVAGVGARVIATNEQIQQKNEEAKEISKAKTQLAALTESEARIRSYFVADDAVVAFLEEVGLMGKALGSSVSVVSVTEKTSKNGRAMLDLSIQISGSFSSVMRTVGALEYAPYDITLTNLSIDATNAENGIWTASASYQVGTTKP